MTQAEMEPLFWLAAFAVAFGVHLFIHPKSSHFRHAIRWIRSNPAPLLVLAASLIIHEGLKVWPGDLGAASEKVAHPLEPWQNVWANCLLDGWKGFTALFHFAIMPPPVLLNIWVGPAIQSLVAAASQVWFCCFYINTQRPFVEDGISFRHAISRSAGILLLALCQYPWWLLQQPDFFAGSPLLLNVLLPEYFLLLAPLPFALAATNKGFLSAGGVTLQILKQQWGGLLVFALSAVPILGLLEYALQTSQAVLPTKWVALGVITGSSMTAFIHVWLYASILPLFVRTVPPPVSSLPSYSS